MWWSHGLPVVVPQTAKGGAEAVHFGGLVVWGLVGGGLAIVFYCVEAHSWYQQDLGEMELGLGRVPVFVDED